MTKKIKEHSGIKFEPKGTDTVPAMLTPNEYVIKAESAKKIGYDNLEHMNETGELPTNDSRERTTKNLLENVIGKLLIHAIKWNFILMSNLSLIFLTTLKMILLVFLKQTVLGE